MKEIQTYNEVDCRALMEAIAYLRNATPINHSGRMQLFFAASCYFAGGFRVCLVSMNGRFVAPLQAQDVNPSAIVLYRIPRACSNGPGEV